MKYALRQLARSPGFTLVALATLALGIGVNTTAFTALNRLLLHALPFPQPERLVQVWATSPRWVSSWSVSRGCSSAKPTLIDASGWV